MDFNVQVKGKTELRDLIKVVPGTKKIKYGDLVASKLAIRFGILNMPSEQQWKNLESLAKDIIQPIMDKFKGIEITSCFRALELNNQVRGAFNSDHIHGYAVDLNITSGDYDNMDAIEWVYKNLSFKKLIAENFPNGWIHISYIIGNNDKKLLLKPKDEKNIKPITISELIELYGKKIPAKKIKEDISILSGIPPIVQQYETTQQVNEVKI